MDWHRKVVVITGASSGIGEEFARSVAARGGRPVLVARRIARLEALARQIRAEHRVEAATVEMDLAQPDAGGRLSAALRSHSMTADVLINNAGFATHQVFAQADPARIAEEVALDVGAVVSITRALLPEILCSGSGAVVNVASTAAFQPIPSMAVYGASKAFVLSFSEALWGELEGTGVRVLALCPGATETEFFGIAGEGASVGNRQTPQQVVATAMRALDSRRRPPVIVSGRGNALVARLPRLVSRRQLIRITRRVVAAPVR